MGVDLRVANLSKTYGSGDTAVHAVRDVSFEAASGEFISVVGPSGSGKTTLLAMLGALLKPTRGTIEVDNRDITRLNQREQARFRREAVGYVFQANNLIPYLTARENLLLMPRISGKNGKAGRKRAEQLLEELGLTSRADAVATELSGGERQRVAIARALMNEPDVLLADEPTGNLDADTGSQIIQQFADLHRQGQTIVMVTHDHAVASAADRQLHLTRGQLAGDPNASPKARG